MSEPMFPSGGGVATAPPPVADERVEPTNNRKALVVVGAVVAVLVVVAGLWLLMSSGSSDDAGDSTVVPPAAAGVPGGAPVAAPTQPVVKPASLNVSKNDPFAPLYPTPVATSGANESPAAPGGGQTAAPDPTPVVPAVTLEVNTINVDQQTASVSVDGKKYKGLGVGDAFGGHYTLYSVFNAQCVGVLYGDQSVPVCLNKPVAVTP